MTADHLTLDKQATGPKNPPSPTLIQTPEIIIEEMACAIAQAQAALFAGRYADLESCAVRLQDLCEALKKHGPGIHNRYAVENGQVPVQIDARRVRQEVKLFAAVLRRMRRHLEALRGLMHGPSLTYRPQPATLPERES